MSKRQIRRNSKRKPRFTEVEKVAYYMGQVQRGLKNPDSKISDSYKAGATAKTKKPKKSLF